MAWQENSVYPGTHWLYYTNRGHYRARVDFAKWTNGQYLWRVMHYVPGKDVVGYEETLEAAQLAAEDVMNGKPHQLRLMI
jgi:hypothetical protein